MADSSRISWAVTATTGFRKPASRPEGTPRSRSITSPEVSVEALDFALAEWGAQFLPHPLLSEAACGDTDSLSNCRTEFFGESVEFFVSLSVYPTLVLGIRICMCKYMQRPKGFSS